jgi:hypothetical protein
VSVLEAPVVRLSASASDSTALPSAVRALRGVTVTSRPAEASMPKGAPGPNSAIGSESFVAPGCSRYMPRSPTVSPAPTAKSPSSASTMSRIVGMSLSTRVYGPFTGPL